MHFDGKVSVQETLGLIGKFRNDPTGVETIDEAIWQAGEWHAFARKNDQPLFGTTCADVVDGEVISELGDAQLCDRIEAACAVPMAAAGDGETGGESGEAAESIPIGLIITVAPYLFELISRILKRRG